METRLHSSSAAAGTPARGWLFYDGDCGWCVRLAARFEGPLERRGFRSLPLQAPGVAEALDVPVESLLDEVRFLLPDGRQFGGADALVAVARRIWWALPFVALARIPAAMPILRRFYRAVAARRSCNVGSQGLN